MKKVLTIMLCLCAALALKAQTIKVNDAFWNGRVLYTVSEIRIGTIVYMQGVDSSGNEYELTLEKVGKKAGNYKLIPSRQADDSPFRCPWNSRVTYIRKNGMYFLAFYNAKNNLIVETMVLTPDNIESLAANQEDVNKRSVASLVSSYLMCEELTTHLNTGDMEKCAKKLALKKNRSIIEDTNMQLMKSELLHRKQKANNK